MGKGDDQPTDAAMMMIRPLSRPPGGVLYFNRAGRGVFYDKGRKREENAKGDPAAVRGTTSETKILLNKTPG
jgi:hypothetical protein